MEIGLQSWENADVLLREPEKKKLMRESEKIFRIAFFLGAAVLLASGFSSFADDPGNIDGGIERDPDHPKRQLNLPAEPFCYTKPTLPDFAKHAARRLDNQPNDNPLTDDGATLGRVLFYDVTLSANRTTSCASCHQQSHGFAEPRKVSIGFDGKPVDRNSMPLANLRYAPTNRFFWDQRAESLEQQVLMPIENEIEMGHRLEDLEKQLAADPIYPPLFRNAFGKEAVTRKRIASALSQFLRSIVSFQSRYDIGRALVKDVREPFPNFTDQENLGKEQFFGRALCSKCHLPEIGENPLSQSAFFQVTRPMANGIDHETGRDRGLARWTRRDRDVGKFKSSSLRNIELTAPYMHDGRFKTIDEVLEHYNWSVKPHPNLDPVLDDFAANGMALPEKEKVALAKFLLTLTDHELIKDERFSDPFARR